MNLTLSIVAAVVAFGVTALMGKVLIPVLHRLKFGQTIREIGPKWHMSKQGTPTMGGLMFIIGICASMCVCIPLAHSLGVGDLAAHGEALCRLGHGACLWRHWIHG